MRAHLRAHPNVVKQGPSARSTAYDHNHSTGLHPTPPSNANCPGAQLIAKKARKDAAAAAVAAAAGEEEAGAGKAEEGAEGEEGERRAAKGGGEEEEGEGEEGKEGEEGAEGEGGEGGGGGEECCEGGGAAAAIRSKRASAGGMGTMRVRPSGSHSDRRWMLKHSTQMRLLASTTTLGARKRVKVSREGRA